MNVFNTLPLFEKIVLSGSMSRAARALGVTRSLVSQQLKELERELGVTLIQRTTRSLHLTEEGRAFAEICHDVLGRFQSGMDAFGEQTAKPSGHLRITAPVDLGEFLLPDILRRFKERYSEITVELLLDDVRRDLVGEGIDVSIRVGWLKDSTMKALKLQEFEPFIVASPRLVEQYPQPKTPPDLLIWPFIALTALDDPYRWHFTHKKRKQQLAVKFNPKLTTNSPLGVLALVQAGCGIGVVPSYQVEDAIKEGTLKRLVPGFQLKKGGIYAVYPGSGTAPHKVKLFLDLLTSG